MQDKASIEGRNADTFYRNAANPLRRPSHSTPKQVKRASQSQIKTPLTTERNTDSEYINHLYLEQPNHTLKRFKHATLQTRNVHRHHQSFIPTRTPQANPHHVQSKRKLQRPKTIPQLPHPTKPRRRTHNRQKTRSLRRNPTRHNSPKILPRTQNRPPNNRRSKTPTRHPLNPPSPQLLPTNNQPKPPTTSF